MRPTASYRQPYASLPGHHGQRRSRGAAIENDYDKEVYNGDIGYIDDVDPDAGQLKVRFDGHVITYGFSELDTLVPAYAATIHKSQGSEYPAVVIPVMTQHYTMLQRNLLYTGVTRGKRPLVLVGQKKAVAIAVRNVSGRRRWSKLKEWLEVATVLRAAHA
jgi:exodeoxyribonuclease V alpha subunit